MIVQYSHLKFVPSIPHSFLHVLSEKLWELCSQIGHNIILKVNCGCLGILAGENSLDIVHDFARLDPDNGELMFPVTALPISSTAKVARVGDQNPFIKGSLGFSVSVAPDDCSGLGHAAILHIVIFVLGVRLDDTAHTSGNE